MSNKSTLMRVSRIAHTKVKVEASKEGKSIMKYVDDLMSIDKEKEKNYRSKEWGKLF